MCGGLGAHGAGEAVDKGHVLVFGQLTLRFASFSKPQSRFYIEDIDTLPQTQFLESGIRSTYQITRARFRLKCLKTGAHQVLFKTCFTHRYCLAERPFVLGGPGPGNSSMGTGGNVHKRLKLNTSLRRQTPRPLYPGSYLVLHDGKNGFILIYSIVNHLCDVSKQWRVSKGARLWTRMGSTSNRQTHPASLSGHG